MSLRNKTIFSPGWGFIIFFVLLFNQGALANCSQRTLPQDFSESYRELFEFTKNLQVINLMGVDECKTSRAGTFPWIFQCDAQGNFLEARALVYETPKVELVFNQERELEITFSRGDSWDYSKVSADEEAQVITRPGQFARIIYTTTSARKVYLHFYRDGTTNLTQLEGLTYRMAIGKPILEAKYSCQNQ